MSKHNARPYEERFWEKVNKATLSGCWEWTASKIDRRYGQLWVGKTNIRAHRLSYMMHFGPIPDDMVVMHLCDNTICVRPEHLKLGTQFENSEDMVLKGRHVIGARVTPAEEERIFILRAQGMVKADIAETLGIGLRTIDKIIGPDTRVRKQSA